MYTVYMYIYINYIMHIMVFWNHRLEDFDLPTIGPQALPMLAKEVEKLMRQRGASDPHHDV